MKTDEHFRNWRKLAATAGDDVLRDKIKTGAGATDDVFFDSANVERHWFEGARRILDFGAGLGRNVPKLLALDPDVVVTLYDSPEMIARARGKLSTRIADQLDRVRFADDFGQVDGDEPFDLIFCALVCQHITPPALLYFAERFRDLSPRLLVSGRRWNDAGGRWSSTWEVIARAGWRVIRCDDAFALDQAPESHHRVLFER